MDWAAYGLPIEGKRADIPTVRDSAHRDVPTCNLTDRIGPVSTHVQKGGWDVCVVVNDQRVVLGLLEPNAWEAHPEERVEKVMQKGPATFRPETPLNQLVERMQRNERQQALVTNLNGQLIGIVCRVEAERRVDAYQRSRSPELNRSRS